LWSGAICVPNVVLFALDDGGEDFAARALEIAAALNIAGSRAQALTVSRDNRTPGTALGAPQHPDTPALFAFMGAATGKR